ncbi:CoA ester lyase [Streptomyces sp. 11-1-2]|uniref:HpcH/HpaI aldolase/citrate lyase family protein n=1 Tax=unclassified Streptomyces TaxID=2593676 RepID=UPI000B8D3251|nr:CoA ester lyase [Streptomyces sp. 11-1-2]ASQ93426.1 CoA ester lyase [Streptomyces sp. 11-1-2]
MNTHIDDLQKSGGLVAAARALLFVPGHRPDRFDKAARSGADLVIVDLEDAVAAEGKQRARQDAADWPGLGGRTVVRVNAPGTPWFEADLRTAADHGCPVMVPKAEDSAALADIAARTAGRCPLIPLIETALGVERAYDLCSMPGVVRAAFGNVDLAAQLGVAHDDILALAHARSRLVLASAAAGICPPVDGVTTAVRDTQALTADTAHARRLGFSGKLCIHPTQIGPVADGFTPSESELRWAQAVLGAGEAVTTVDGHMVDKPVLERARNILACAAKPHTAL